MQTLPAELHLSIAQHLHSDDLPTYRLIAKRYATIGAELIFSVFKFDGYPESLQRLDFFLEYD
jgi:hypothetical protein